MSQIQFGTNSRSFDKFYDWFHIGACAVAILLAIASFFEPGHSMKLFPLIFLDAAALNGVLAYARFRSANRSTHRLSGLPFALVCVALLILAFICGKVVWA
ncbi:hypothetical protein [Hominifimenecus sp. rT4P-3]|uniref:hypothetical protein n=1 Tax=Hominifimenecus sp. rT4P-3 TaxID=3242979 RepID=UPI003DA23C94